MTAVDFWIVRAAGILAIGALCSCVSTYAPVQQPNQPTYSVEEARRVVSNLTVPPVQFFDRRDQSISLNSPIYMVTKVHLRNTSMSVETGYKRYSIPLTDIQPSVYRNEADGKDFVDVYLNDNQGFFANILTTNAAGQVAAIWGGPFKSQESQNLANALLVLKKAAVQFSQDDEARFQEAVSAYRATDTKPQLPEEARRFKVMAESSVRDKEFDNAADFYEQALGVSPWWPAGHFDRALVLSEISDFAGAIAEMKRYLALVPDAPDARAAQDRIYEWQAKSQ